MRRHYGAHRALGVTTLCTSQRCHSIGGRVSPLGFSTPPDKHARVKQVNNGTMAQRIPGTTKLRYTNQRGRTFTFSIPVGQLTHPPVVRRGASAGGWHEIDTSFSDVGNLEDDMPTEVDERLAAAAVAGEAGLVEMDTTQLRELQQAFVQLCREYVLMDTSGMKTSMMYGELNAGPDYEHFDRKSRRRRHWLAIRHRYEDVKELLWPSDLLAHPDPSPASLERYSDATGSSDAPTAEEAVPALSLSEMMEALTWLEAASTFAIRTHRPYDTADAPDFASLDLAREVRVVATRARAALSSARHASHDADATTTADCVISLGALCANHGVPVSVAFSPARHGAPAPASESTAAHAWLSAVPALSRVRDAVRVMTVLHRMAADGGDGATTALLRFSDADGSVTQAPLLHAACRLVAPALFENAAALENVDENELCVLLRFATELEEQNSAFLRADLSALATSEVEQTHLVECRRGLRHFTRLVLSRCRRLLGREGDGASPVTLLSGDGESIPFVDLQAFADHNHPDVRVHEKVGRANAKGLRYARLQANAFTTLAELLARLEAASDDFAVGAHGLRSDLLHRLTHKAALGKGRLALDDVTRALPLLASQMAATSESQVKERYDRLLTAASTTIGVALQQPQPPATILALLEGLAACHYVPSSYKALEMVLLRTLMAGGLSLGEAGRSLTAMLQCVGTHRVSQSVQQAVAMRVVAAVEADAASGVASGDHRRSGDGRAWGAEPPTDVVAVLRALRYSSYPAFASLVGLVERSAAALDAHTWPAPLQVRYGVLLTAAAAATAVSKSEADADVGGAMASSARPLLLRGMSCASEPGCDGEDAFQECLTACAALELDPTPPPLVEWAQTRPAATAVHSLCTPKLAVSTVEALESVGLAPSPWHTAYVLYLTAALRQVQPVEGRAGHRALPPLDDDAETAERCLYLRHAAPELRRVAAALLEAEVGRLDALLDRGGSATTEQGHAGAPVTTFQHRALERQAAATATEGRLLRYCAALQHHQQQQQQQQQPSSGDHASAAA